MLLMYFKQHVSLYPERCKFIHFFAASRITRKSLFAIFGFGQPGTYPLRLSFAVCRIRGVSLISVFKRRFLLTAGSWAERGSWFTRGLFYFFLTARPWAERGSWFTRGLFNFFFFLVFSVTRPKLPLGQILNHATCKVYFPKTS